MYFPLLFNRCNLCDVQNVNRKETTVNTRLRVCLNLPWETVFDNTFPPVQCGGGEDHFGERWQQGK